MPRLLSPKLYDRKTALVAADMLNDRVLPLYEDNDVPLRSPHNKMLDRLTATSADIDRQRAETEPERSPCEAEAKVKA